MKLLTKEIIAALKKVPYGSTDGKPHDQRKVIVKFFHPASSYTAYVLEGDEQPDGNWIFFCLVKSLETEFGDVSLRELESCHVRGLDMERDRYFGDHTLAEVEEGKVS